MMIEVWDTGAYRDVRQMGARNLLWPDKIRRVLHQGFETR